MIQMESVQKHVVEWAPRDEDLIPLASFRGNIPLATIRARWTLLQAMKDAEIESVAKICTVSEEQRDETHFCGLHGEIKRRHWGGMLSRIVSSPSIIKLDPSMIEYVRWVAEQSRVLLYRLDPITRTSFRSRWDWRHIARPTGMWVDRQKVILEYPFLPPQALKEDENELLMLAHRTIPKHFPHELRGDLCQDLIVEMLLGEIDKNDLSAQLPGFLKRTLRKYPRKYDGISLESKFGDDERTFGERLSWERVSYA